MKKLFTFLILSLFFFINVFPLKYDIPVTQNKGNKENLNYKDYKENLIPKKTEIIEYFITEPNNENTSSVLSSKHSAPLKSTQQYFLLVTNIDEYPELENSIETYAQDLLNQGILLISVGFNGSSHEDLKHLIKTYYTSNSIIGVFLVGNLPVPWYEMEEIWWGDWVEFPIPLYYSDLDGQWIDSDSNGIYDEHTGDMQPEIYAGVLKADNLPLTGENETDLLNSYFERNHKFRKGEFHLSGDALLYVDDDWSSWVNEYQNGFDNLYPNLEVHSDIYETNAADYKNNRLPYYYDFIQVMVHSSPDAHFFYAGSNYALCTNSEVFNINPNTYFYNLFACSNARFTNPNNMGSIYVLGSSLGLGAAGSTKTGSMLDFDKFYNPLNEGYCFGESFNRWWAETVDTSPENYQEERSWFYGLVFIGDPLLSLKKDFHLTNYILQTNDGDTIPDAGENCELYCTLYNPQYPADTIYADIQCSDPNIIIPERYVNIMMINNGEGLYFNENPFMFQISENIPDNYPFTITLNAEAELFDIHFTAYKASVFCSGYKVMESEDDYHSHKIEFALTNFGGDHAGNLNLQIESGENIIFDPFTYIKDIPPYSSDTLLIYVISQSDYELIHMNFTGDNYIYSQPVLINLEDFQLIFSGGESDTLLLSFYKGSENYNNGWGISNVNSFSPPECYNSYMNYTSLVDGIIEFPFIKARDSEFSFMSYIYSEMYHDGGFITASNSGTEEIIHPQPDYNLSVNTSYYQDNDNLPDLDNIPAFSGIKTEWEEYEIDMTQFNGLVQFKFRYLSDSGVSYTGWFLDDFSYSVNNTGIQETDIIQDFIESYPNPFNPSTVIRYYVSEVSEVKLKIYNINGELVNTLYSGTKAPGFHFTEWNGKNILGERVSNGVYFAVLEGFGKIYSKKIMLIK